MRHHDHDLHLYTHSRHLLVVVGQSGVGKDAVINAWLRRFPTGERPHLARRVITRERHSSEDHEPATVADFLAMAADGYFGFRWQAHGLHYGVRWSELAPLREGRCVVVNGSRQHLPRLRELAPQVRVVEIVLPDALRVARLHGRGRETPSELGSRLSRTTPDSGADLVIDNSGPLDDTVAALHAWWSAGTPSSSTTPPRQPAQA